MSMDISVNVAKRYISGLSSHLTNMSHVSLMVQSPEWSPGLWRKLPVSSVPLYTEVASSMEKLSS